MGPGMEADPIVPRSERETAGWGFIGREIGRRIFHVHGLCVVSTIAGRSSGRLSVIREYGVARCKMSMPNDTDARSVGEDAVEPSKAGGSWRRAYALALALFAVEVILLYFFT